jgi:glycosyltransferase involved in cell wall biosynthesis
MSPLFSIVVPSLNQGQFLEQALVSLFNQGGERSSLVR